MNNREKKLQNDLNDYIEERKKFGTYKHFWGGTFGGFSKNEKLAAAEALLDFIRDKNVDTFRAVITHEAALNQGNLKELWESFREENRNLYETYYNELNPQLDYLDDGYDSDVSSYQSDNEPQARVVFQR